MRLAAIDIGSNAVRLQITRILIEDAEPIYKKLEYVRFPLRLGTDVFKTGELTFRSEAKFIDLIQAFRTLIDLYEANDVFACATSAMRDANNGKRILKRAYQKSGVKIELIDGDLEAELIDMAIDRVLRLPKYIGIDVGGGSTEISIVENGIILKRSSFRLGSVRNMQGREPEGEWQKIVTWCNENLEHHVPLVGTGGNIRSILKFIKNEPNDEASYDGLVKANDYVRGYSLTDRVQKLQLREDRADVINYATDIYLKVMELTQSPKILVPNVGLKDGIIEMLFDRNK